RVRSRRDELRGLAVHAYGATAALDLNADVLDARHLLVRAEHDDEALGPVRRDVHADDMALLVEQQTRRHVPVERRPGRGRDDEHGRGRRVVGVAGSGLLGEHETILGSLRAGRHGPAWPPMARRIPDTIRPWDDSSDVRSPCLASGSSRSRAATPAPTLPNRRRISPGPTPSP